MLDEQLVDLVLRHRVPARRLADVDDLHVGAEFVEHGERGQPIDDDDVSRRQFTTGPKGEQVLVARPAADEHHVPARRAVPAQRQRA